MFGKGNYKRATYYIDTRFDSRGTSHQSSIDGNLYAARPPMIIVSTLWEHRPISSATATHLGLAADDRVWVRTVEGVPYFIVLRVGQTPDIWTPGYPNLDTALALRGR